MSVDRTINTCTPIYSPPLTLIQGLLRLHIRMMPHAAPCQCALHMRIGHVELGCQKLVRARERLQLNRA